MTLLAAVAMLAIQAPPTFRVLLVGMGPYAANGSAFPNLNGESDARNLAARLKSAYNLKDENFHFVLGKEATKAKIEGEFRDWLVKDAKPGDTLVYFVSGHGTLVPDPSYAAGVRGATVPIDFQVRTDGSIDETSVITSRFYNEQITNLSKSGVENVTLIFDTCHAGSVARGKGEVVAKWIENPGAKARPVPATRGVDTGYDFGGSVVIAAARSDRSAYENRPEGGNLTVALCRALRRQQERQAAGASAFSYRQLFAAMRAEMETLDQPIPQEPILAGPASDREVFGRKMEAIEPYFTMLPKGSGWKIDGGRAVGIEANHVIGIYPIGTRKFGGVKPIATAVVTKSDAFESEVKLREAVAPSALSGAPAQIVDGLPDAFLRLDLSRVTEPISELAKLPLVRREDAAADVVIVPPGAKKSTPDDYDSSPGTWRLFDAGKSEAFAEVASNDPRRVESLLDLIRDAARHRSLQRLETPSPYVKVEAEMVPVRFKEAKEGEVTEAILPPRPMESLLATDRFAIRLRAVPANGIPMRNPELALQEAPYISVLDLLPRKEVKCIWPEGGLATNPEGRRLPPDGEWRYLGTDGLVRSNTVSEIIPWGQDPIDGPGRETFKIFATRTNVSLAPFLTSARSGSKSGTRGDSRLADLLDSFKEGLPIERTGTKAGAPSEFGVVSITVNIPDR